MPAFERKKIHGLNRFRGNGSCGKFPTNKEPIRTLGFTLPYNAVVLFLTFAFNYPDLRPVKLRPSGCIKSSDPKNSLSACQENLGREKYDNIVQSVLTKDYPVRCLSIQCHRQNLQKEREKTSQRDKPAEQA